MFFFDDSHSDKCEAISHCCFDLYLTKVCLVKAMVFPVVGYGGESWMIKKAECRRINTFEL